VAGFECIETRGLFLLDETYCGICCPAPKRCPIGSFMGPNCNYSGRCPFGYNCMDGVCCSSIFHSPKFKPSFHKLYGKGSPQQQPYKKPKAYPKHRQVFVPTPKNVNFPTLDHQPKTGPIEGPAFVPTPTPDVYFPTTERQRNFDVKQRHVCPPGSKVGRSCSVHKPCDSGQLCIKQTCCSFPGIVFSHLFS